MSKEFTLENFTVADCNRFAVDNAKFVASSLVIYYSFLLLFPLIYLHIFYHWHI